MLPSPQELKYFYQAALSLNISKAAKLLHTTQPTLSMAIKRLEHKLNAQLFQRLKEGLILTQEGSALLLEVKELLNKWEGVKLNVSSYSEEIKGRVTIGCHSNQNTYMVKVISYLMHKYPSIEFNLKHNLSKDTLQGILEKDIDIGVVVNPPQHTSLSIHKIRNSDVAFWSNGKPTIHNQANSKQATILCDLSIPIMQTQIKQLKLKNISYGKISDLNCFETISQLTVEGFGIGMLSDCYVDLLYADKLYRCYELPYLSIELCMVYRQADNQVKLITTVINDMKEFSRRYSEEMIV